jgi:hypothetical protein
MINLSFKKLFQFQTKVRVLRRNLGHEGFGASKGIKHRKIKKIDHNRTFLQKKISV